MQRHTHDLVRGLVASGHDVEVICPVADELAPDSYGARWTLLETTGRSDHEWPAKVLAAYRAGQRRSPFDVVHSESTSALPLIHAKVATPIAIKYHGNYLGLAKAHVRRALARPRTALVEARRLVWVSGIHFRKGNAWGFRRCISMVPSHQQLRDTARSHFIHRELLHVVPNGVDVELFRPGDRARMRRELRLEDGVLVASVGRLNLEKGFDIALEVVARAAHDHPDVRLVVVGEGEERSRLEQLSRKLGVAERTDFVGLQSNERVADYLAAADLFLFPTQREEAGPLVVPQAMAAGLPVVASRVGGISEVLEPPTGRPVGILVHPGSVDDAERAVRALLGDPSLRESLGQSARERAVDEYSLETMVARTVDVYRLAIARSR